MNALRKKNPIDLEAQKKNRRRWKFNSVFVIKGQDGEPYLHRRTLFATPWFAVMLHRFLRSDADRCLHDHPWGFVSVILSGGYFEETPVGSDPRYTNLAWYPRFSVLYRPAKWRHRVILAEGVQPLTLVIRGSYKREWGFWTRQGWRHWTHFIERKNAGEDLC